MFYILKSTYLYRSRGYFFKNNYFFCLQGRKHMDGYIYQCIQCPYTCETKARTLSHLHKHRRNHLCPECGYETRNKRLFKAHKNWHFNAVPTFKWNKCHYITHRKNNLELHTRIHLVQKLFNCELCPYLTSRKSNLKRHCMSKH